MKDAGKLPIHNQPACRRRPEDFEKLNKYLLGHLFDRTVAGSKMLTGRELTSRMKGYEFLHQLLPEERTALNNTLDQFLVLNPSLATFRSTLCSRKSPRVMKSSGSAARYCQTLSVSRKPSNHILRSRTYRFRCCRSTSGRLRIKARPK